MQSQSEMIDRFDLIKVSSLIVQNASESNKCELFYGSEVPCRLIGGPHERFNESHTVLNYYSAKLRWP